MRVGLAGYSVGRTIHAPLIAAAGAEVAAIATADPVKIALAAEHDPAATVVPDLTALLVVPGLDAIVLATPTGAHAEHIRACVAAGVPVVVDKPLTVDAAQARAVVAEAEAAGVPITVFQNRRYDAGHRAVRALLDAGRLGTINRYEFRWERWRPVPKQRWREESLPQDGGGILLDLHAHMIDAAVDLFGRVERVYAEIAARTTRAEDDTFLSCVHAGGVVSHLTASSVCGAPGPRLRVLGSAGAFVYDDFEGTLAYPDLADPADPAGAVGWIVTGEERAPGPVLGAPAGGALQGLSVEGSAVAFYAAVASALRAPDPQRAMPVDPWDAVHVLEVIDAARVSARTAASVAIPAG